MKLEIQEAINWIDGNIEDDLTLKRISSFIGYSPFHTSRKFKEYTGSTLRSYIMLRRLSLAAKELRDKNVRIIDIAFKYGFHSQEAFTKSFFNAFKINPGEYVKTKRPIPLVIKKDVLYPENLNNKGMIANPITLKNFFEKDNMLNEVGGTEYLVKLTRFSGSAKQAFDYAKIVHEMYLRRELVQISDKLSSDTLNANSQEQNAESIIEGTEKSLFDLAERGSFSQSFLKFNEALDQTIEMATLAMKSDQGINR